MGKQHQQHSGSRGAAAPARRTAQQAGFESDAARGASRSSKKARLAHPSGKQQQQQQQQQRQHVRSEKGAGSKQASNGHKKQGAAANGARRGPGSDSDEHDDDSTKAESSDEELSPEDLAFFRSNPSAMSFLSNFDASAAALKKDKKQIQLAKGKPQQGPEGKKAYRVLTAADLDSSDDEGSIAEDDFDSDVEDFDDAEDGADDEEEEDEDDDDAGEDDDEVEDGDESDASSVHLSDIEEEFNERHGRTAARKPGKSAADDENMEEQYEQAVAARSKGGKDPASEEGGSRMPLKTKQGLVMVTAPMAPSVAKQNKRADEPAAPAPTKRPVAVEEPVDEVQLSLAKAMPDLENMPLAALIAWRQQQLSRAKQQLAEFASQIMENPEVHVGLFKQIGRFYRESDDIRIQKLAMLTAVRVFKDILPAYRIRDTGDEEDGKQQVSKEIKKIQAFETALLGQYQQFLLFLDKCTKDFVGLGNKHGEDKNELATESVIKLAECAITCMGELLLQNPYFNFSVNLIATLVPLMGVRKPENFAAPICATIVSLFQNDPKGEAVLDVVKVVAKLVKAKNYNLPRTIVDPFLRLRLDSDLEAVKDINPIDNHKSAQSRKKPHMSKKEKKKTKVAAELDRAMRETEAEVSKVDRQRMQTETLKWVFLTYFRVLKNATRSPLLPGVLEGLAKFAHLINIDFFSDLMSVLKNLLVEETVSIESKIHCVKAAFQILTGQGEVLNIDLKDFYAALYAALPAVVGEERLIRPLVSCLELMLRQRKQSIDRVAAFVKRLCSIATNLSAEGSLALMTATRGLMKNNPRCEQLLDSDVSSTGVYRAELDDPEHACAFATTLWELPLLQSHYHPYVQTFTHHILQGAPLDGKDALSVPEARRSSVKIFDEYDTAEGGFKPPIPPPKVHPLQKQLGKSGAERGVFVKFRPLQSEYLREFAAKMADQEIASSANRAAASTGLRTHFELLREQNRQVRLMNELRRLRATIHAFERDE
ncbi:hypothetical protein CAOG_00300 [Capsaspora owczarzaki ATCC 30864]|uniref:Nucleolar complex protein 3 homolog n=1 Tax=Capsaspora owczarzaki (strain ATCC 30864) TaxID=595528 RepID=A0A0D2VFZ8_CAPO3|nr:hypothetical protein CAOG_00300 [Capsaspora owczarzaki ATCC 30864]KJE88702.1 hypothetical protein CAOG_000300 [Capsaspora owczarzaki ATCC 30864]|eukprot:XP_004365171.1 hypothetical protein CAOG_00300 [Capsaspora owczarzaki ATCC 30864]